MLAINTWAVSVMRYGVKVVSWTKMEFQNVDRETRKHDDYLSASAWRCRPPIFTERKWGPWINGGGRLCTVEGN